MFELSYLSNENKRALEKLQDRLTKATTPQIRNETELAIQEILARAKPYTRCDLIEADELRSQLLNKINVLAGLGKSAESFRMHLREVEFHMQTVQMQEVLKEKQKHEMRPEEPPNLRDRIPTLGSMKRDKKKKEAFGSHRWQIGFDDEPDDTQK